MRFFGSFKVGWEKNLRTNSKRMGAPRSNCPFIFSTATYSDLVLNRRGRNLAVTSVHVGSMISDNMQAKGGMD